MLFESQYLSLPTKGILSGIVVLFFLSSCQNSREENSQVSDQMPFIKEERALEIEASQKFNPKKKREEVRHNAKLDSLRMAKALSFAQEIAQSKLNQKQYHKEFLFNPGDSSYLINVAILMGDFFDDEFKYLIFKRGCTWASFRDVFRIENEEKVKLFSTTGSGVITDRDTIFDVNGDERKDYVIQWYAASGCCRRNAYDVYLNLPGGTFSSKYEFINPTFSADERLIRGVTYGHPGEAGLYKYRWNGLKVDTLEYIYHDTSQVGQFIKTHKPTFFPSAEEGVVLNDLPEEYKGIEDYDWFSIY